MKKMFFCALLLAGLFSSCMVNRHTVGEGPIGNDKTAKVYSKAKQVYLFWGLMPLGHSQPEKPANHYQIKSGHNVVDALVSGLTGGFLSLRTVKILTKEGK